MALLRLLSGRGMKSPSILNMTCTQKQKLLAFVPLLDDITMFKLAINKHKGMKKY
jgi:hypothetical protein